VRTAGFPDHVFPVLSLAVRLYTAAVISRLGLTLAVLTILVTASAVEAHSPGDHAGASVAYPGGIDLAEPIGADHLPITLLIAVAIAGALWTARVVASRLRGSQVACIAAALLLVTTTAQASPHLVHHVFDKDAGKSCTLKQVGDLVGGLTIDPTLPAPAVATLPSLVQSQPDPPSVFRSVDRSRSPPPAR